MKRRNPYTDLQIYTRTPKAVFAALAVSFAERLDPTGLDLDAITDALLAEWRTLHANGIVPQAPPHLAKAARRAS